MLPLGHAVLVWSHVPVGTATATPHPKSNDSSNGHLRNNRHAWRKQVFWIRRLVKHDFDRYTLDHLDVVTSRVFRRYQTESRPCAALETIDVATENFVRICIHFDVNRLAHCHSADLALFEICRDPNVCRHDGQQRLADLDECALFNEFARYPAV